MSVFHSFSRSGAHEIPSHPLLENFHVPREARPSRRTKQSAKTVQLCKSKPCGRLFESRSTTRQTTTTVVVYFSLQRRIIKLPGFPQSMPTAKNARLSRGGARNNNGDRYNNDGPTRLRTISLPRSANSDD